MGLRLRYEVSPPVPREASSGRDPARVLHQPNQKVHVLRDEGCNTRAEVPAGKDGLPPPGSYIPDGALASVPAERRQEPGIPPSPGLQKLLGVARPLDPNYNECGVGEVGVQYTARAPNDDRGHHVHGGAQLEDGVRQLQVVDAAKEGAGKGRVRVGALRGHGPLLVAGDGTNEARRGGEVPSDVVDRPADVCGSLSPLPGADRLHGARKCQGAAKKLVFEEPEGGDPQPYAAHAVADAGAAEAVQEAGPSAEAEGRSGAGVFDCKSVCVVALKSTPPCSPPCSPPPPDGTPPGQSRYWERDWGGCDHGVTPVALHYEPAAGAMSVYPPLQRLLPIHPGNPGLYDDNFEDSASGHLTDVPSSGVTVEERSLPTAFGAASPSRSLLSFWSTPPSPDSQAFSEVMDQDTFSELSALPSDPDRTQSESSTPTPSQHTQRFGDSDSGLSDISRDAHEAQLVMAEDLVAGHFYDGATQVVSSKQ